MFSKNNLAEKDLWLQERKTRSRNQNKKIIKKPASMKMEDRLFYYYLGRPVVALKGYVEACFALMSLSNGVAMQAHKSEAW
jgi:hypothetical protein